eukprot:jgi/Tetstr1/466330/TSEL_010861.t1
MTTSRCQSYCTQRAESGYEAVRPVSRVPGLFPLSTDLTNEYLKQDDWRLPAQEEYLWMSCFGAHMAALFVALNELLPYVPAASQDFTPYLARARNHAEAIDKAFRFRLAFLRRLNEGAGVDEDVVVEDGGRGREDELGQRTLDLLSSSLTAQTLKSYAGRLSQFAEFCHDSESLSPPEATTATAVRYVAWIGTQPTNPAGASAPEGGEQGAREPLPAELDAPDNELSSTSNLPTTTESPALVKSAPPRDVDEPRLWTQTDDTARALAEKRSQAAYDEYLHLNCYAFFSSCANEAMRGALESLSTKSAIYGGKQGCDPCRAPSLLPHPLGDGGGHPFPVTLEISLSAAGKARAAAAFAKATPDKPAPTEYAERRKQREQAAAARKAAATAATADKAKAKPGTNKWRLIIDLWELNKWCKTFTMSCETLKHWRHLARAGGWFVSMDLADGYYALGIREEDRDFFTVNYRGELW